MCWQAGNLYLPRPLPRMFPLEAPRERFALGVASAPSGAAVFRFAAGLRCLGTCRSLVVGRQGRGSNALRSPIFSTKYLIDCKMYDIHTI